MSREIIPDLTLDFGESATIRIGDRHVVIAAYDRTVIDEHDEPCYAVSLGGADCDLDGDEPGFYYLVPRAG